MGGMLLSTCSKFPCLTYSLGVNGLVVPSIHSTSEHYNNIYI